MNSPTSRRPRSRASGASALELFTLGGVRLVRDGVDETAKLGSKHLALLVYLFHEMRPMAPSEVIELLGRGQSQDKELEALKRAVGWLRENLPVISIRLTGDTIEGSGGLRLDTKEVDRAIDTGDSATVITLYRGEFLEGFESGAPAFDEWAQRERGRLWRAWSNAIIGVAGAAEAKQAWEDAAVWWKALVARAPMRAEAVAGLLRAYAEAGRNDEAAQAFTAYAERLRQAGMAEPAAAVKRVIAKYPPLKDIADVGGAVTPEVAEPSAPPRAPSSQQGRMEPSHESPVSGDEPGELEGGDRLGEEGRPAIEEEVDSATGEGDAEADASWDAFLELEVREPKPRVDEPEGPPAEGSGETKAAGTARQAEGGEDVPKPAAQRSVPEGVEEPLGPDETEPGRPEPEVAAAKGRIDDDRTGTASPTAAAFVDTGFGTDVRGRAFGIRRRPRRRLGGLAAVVAAPFKLVLAVARGVARAGHIATGGRSVAAALRRFWYVPSAVIAILLALAFGPPLLSVLGFGEDADAVPDVQTAMPNLSLPKVSVPKITLRTPTFVETSVSRIGAMLSGPILDEPGNWLVVADVVVQNAADVEAVQGPQPPGPGQPAGATGSDASIGDSDAATAGSAGGASESATVTPGDTADRSEDGRVVGAAATPSPAAPKGVERDPDGLMSSDSGSPAVTDDEGDASPGNGLEAPGRGHDAEDVPDAEDAESSTSADLAISSAVLTLGLETDLSQSRFFYVVPRERALAALRQRTGRQADSLSVTDALSIAAAEGHAAVLSARVVRYTRRDSVELRVLSVQGDTLYGVAAEVPDGSRPFETLAGLTRAVRRRLGESGDEVDNSLLSAQILSTAPGALVAYAQARRHLFAGRYYQAVVAANEATRRDSTFAMAYRTLAQGYAMVGQRQRARLALESAWRLSGRVADRERLRILADRHAWDGRFREAILAYDDLFSRYRDDVAALRSQAIVQRMLGVRGAGEGNLRVAYTIDPHDWPPLSRIARYLGYQGPLPDVDSLVAEIQPPQRADTSLVAPIPDD